MSESDGETRARQRLVAVVERHRQEKCAELLERANQQARQLIREAFREAHSRGRQGIAEVRQQYRDRIGAARAQQQTQLRLRRQRDNGELLAALWEPLRSAVQARWGESEARRAWIDALVRLAAARLRDKSWSIEHPVDWPESEQAELRERLGASLNFVPQEALTAGLRIRAGGACVDGSVEGLLWDRTRVQSLLLARLIERRRKEQTAP
jgi:vacuolar-type H+-ATPase subunit H